MNKNAYSTIDMSARRNAQMGINMNADTWLIVAIAGFVVAGIAAVTAAILYFLLHIHSVIGDLSGKTIAREIKAIRESNEQSGDKSFRSSRINIERGKLTEKVEEIAKERGQELAATGKLTGARRWTADTTTLLQTDVTTLLREEGTTLLGVEGTTVLEESMVRPTVQPKADFKIKRKIIEIHTEEQVSLTGK